MLSIDDNTIIFNKAGFYTNDNNIRMSITEVQNLRSLAFTDEQIRYMDFEEFINNRNLVGEVVSSDIVHVVTVTYSLQGSQELQSYDFLITEAEYNTGEITLNSVDTLGKVVHETTMKKLQTSIIKVTNGTKVTYRLRNDLTYKTMPKTRSHDVFGMRHDSTVSGIPETATARLSWSTVNDCTGVKENKLTNYTWGNANWKRSPSGYGIPMKLPENAQCVILNQANPRLSIIKDIRVTSISAYMYYDVQKLLTTTINTLNAYGSYQHATSNISLNTSLSFSIGPGGLGMVLQFSPSDSKNFDGMGGTQGYLTNLNW